MEPRELDATKLARLWGDEEPRVLDAQKLANLPGWESLQPSRVVDAEKFSSVSPAHSKTSQAGRAFTSGQSLESHAVSSASWSASGMRVIDPQKLPGVWLGDEGRVLDPGKLANLAAWSGDQPRRALDAEKLANLPAWQGMQPLRVIDAQKFSSDATPGRAFAGSSATVWSDARAAVNAAPFAGYLSAIAITNEVVRPEAEKELARLQALGDATGSGQTCSAAAPLGLPSTGKCGCGPSLGPTASETSKCSPTCSACVSGAADAIPGGQATPFSAKQKTPVARATLPPFAGKRDVTDRWRDPDSVERWKDLSRMVSLTREHGVSSLVNPLLVAESAREPNLAFAPLYALWAIDSYIADGAHEAALHLANEFLKVFPERTFQGRALSDIVLGSAAYSARALGDAAAAEGYLLRLVKQQAAGKRADAVPWYSLGTLYEEHGRTDEAIWAFGSAGTSSSGGAWTAGYAARDVRRLSGSASPGRRQRPELVAQELIRALRAKDHDAIAKLASPTHFSVGYLGHLAFADRSAFLDALVNDLRDSVVSGDPMKLVGVGAKRYLQTSGWLGGVFHGTVRLGIFEASSGWEWRAIAFDNPTSGTDAFMRQQFGTPPLYRNDPLAIPIKAPWPAGMSFMAGGGMLFIGLETQEGAGYIVGGIAAAVACAAAGPFYPVCAAVAIPAAITANFLVFAAIRQRWADRPCGFGPGGSYYNQWRHTSGPVLEEQYAIDFLRFEQSNAFARNLSAGTPILAVHDGVVLFTRREAVTGSEVETNSVMHSCVGDLAETRRYVASYVHLDGPHRLFVSEMMWVDQGNLLGYCDDTGPSSADHLHFDIHDGTLVSALAGAGTGAASEFFIPGLGRTTRPTPMDVDESGVPQTLEGDGTGYGLVGNESRCILSTNRRTFPATPVTPRPPGPTTSRAYCLWVAEQVMSVSFFHGLLLLALCDRLPPDAP